MEQPTSSRPASTPLWGKETALALDNFPVSGRPLPIEVIHALAAIKAEAAAVNVELGAPGVTEQVAAAIARRGRAVERGEHDDQFLIDVFQTGSGTSSNMNVNEVVARLASDASGVTVHPNDHVNAGQSSNDTFPTAVPVAALAGDHDAPAARRVEQLAESLEAAADRFAYVVKSGRTHLMDAVPVTLGAEFGGYAAQVARGDRAVGRLRAAARPCAPRRHGGRQWPQRAPGVRRARRRPHRAALGDPAVGRAEPLRRAGVAGLASWRRRRSCAASRWR